VGGVAVQHGRVVVLDHVVVEDDDLGEEAAHLVARLVLVVGGDVTAVDVLDGEALDVEANVVSRLGLVEGLVVHLDGLDLGGLADRREAGDHAGLDDAGLDAADRHCADALDLVHVLERQAQRLVGGALRGLGLVEHLHDGQRDVLLLVGVVPRDVLLGELVVDEVGAGPAGDGQELGLLVDALLLEEELDLVADLVEALLAERLGGGGVHLVAANNELLDAQGVGQDHVLLGGALDGPAGLEATGVGGDHDHGEVGLRRAGDHVLDEVAVARGVDDGPVILLGPELPEGNVDGDARSRSDLSLSSTQAYLNEPLPVSAASFSYASITRGLMPPSL